MTLYDHIQQLRAELSRCCDAAEIRQIEAELEVAEAEYAVHIAAWRDEGG